MEICLCVGAFFICLNRDILPDASDRQELAVESQQTDALCSHP